MKLDLTKEEIVVCVKGLDLLSASMLRAEKAAPSDVLKGGYSELKVRSNAVRVKLEQLTLVGVA